MKSLKEYINENLHHDLSIIYMNIDESGGLYDGEIQLASFIADNIIETYNNNRRKFDYELQYDADDLMNFENIFFNNIIINVKRSIRGQMISTIDLYDTKNSDEKCNTKNMDDMKRFFHKKYNYLIDEKRLDKILITISCNINSKYEDITGRIAHELNHAYTYWDMLTDDLSQEKISKETFVPEKYHNALHIFSNNIYNKITSGLKIKDINDYDTYRNASYILYREVDTRILEAWHLSFGVVTELVKHTAELVVAIVTAGVEHVVATHIGDNLIRSIDTRTAHVRLASYHVAHETFVSGCQSCLSINIGLVEFIGGCNTLLFNVELVLARCQRH